MRRGFLAIALAALVAGNCASANADDIFYYATSPTSWVGGGQTKPMTSAEGATFEMHEWYGDNSVGFVIGDATDGWTLIFDGPNHSFPYPGNYTNVAEFGTQGNAPGFSGMATAMEMQQSQVTSKPWKRHLINMPN